MWLAVITPVSSEDEGGARIWYEHPEDGLISVRTDIEKDRFKLWSDCKAMYLVVFLQKNDVSFELTEETIKTLVRSRLRAARLFSDLTFEAWLKESMERGTNNQSTEDLPFPPNTTLGVSVHIVGQAYNVELEYLKHDVIDTITGSTSPLATWSSGVLGVHGNDPNFILSSLSKMTDTFIDEYLRINADACRKQN